MRCPARRAAGSLAVAVLASAVMAGVVLAHPLGNFTINHHAGIRVEPDRIVLDVVIDRAEIPTFQVLRGLDDDGDGELSDAELEATRRGQCAEIAADLSLLVGGSPATLRLEQAGVSFPPGNGGLSTMRVVCVLVAPLASLLAAGTEIRFEDRFEPSRLGWREMVVTGDRVTLDAPGIQTTSATDRLTRYPTGLTGAPDVRSVTFTVTPGGPALAPFALPDAQPLDAAGDPGSAPGATGQPGGDAAVGPSPSAVPAAGGIVASPSPSQPDAEAAVTGAVPGGEGAIPDILRSSSLTPLLALVALLTAALLGAGHAVTPGHGKTLMAAYLVGTRGTALHAVGLGLAVSVSHTLGILGLAVVILGAASALPPDFVVRVAPVVAALTILGIGGWMLVTELRRGLAARRKPGHGLDHDHGHDRTPALEPSHGGITHRHVPPPGATITWRGLFLLGLAGGLIPSTNALLILLGTVAAGQPAWGVVLVVAFGLGTAAVMTCVGLAFVFARGLLERAPSQTRVARAARLVPLAAAVFVLALGVVLTTQAMAAIRLA